MSLLNDMLRDLSHQQKPTEASAATPESMQDFNAQEQRELFYHTRAVKPLPRTLVPSLAIFVLALIIFSLWKLHFFTSSNPGIATNESVHVAGQAPVTNTAVVRQPAITPSTNTLAQPTNNDVLTPELGKRIAALESAINNLSTVVANANHESIPEPTATDPDFGQAAGYETAFAEPDTQDAAQLSLVEPTSESMANDLSDSVSIQEPFAQSPQEVSLTGQSMSEESAQEKPIQDESLVEQGEPQFSLKPNVKWQDQQQAQQANQLVAQGQINVAIENLQRYIATAAQPRESVKTLLDIFAGQENISAMQNLLTQANYLSMVEQSFYRAKIAVIQQQDAQAIKLLEAHLDKAEQDENYRALLAGLYQRTGMHLEAANHYRRLLSVFGEKPAYWLGFALSQDALNQSKAAAQAYQRVNQYADLQPQVRTYVQQRIAALQE